MNTNIRLLLFRSFSSPPILQNEPISSPVGFSSSTDYSILGVQPLMKNPSRIIIEDFPKPYPYHSEKFTLEIHEKQGKNAEEFDFFLADFYEQHNGPSNMDAVLIWGFDKELGHKIFSAVKRHSSPPTLICLPTNAVISTCNKCVQSSCRHLQYDFKFWSSYWKLLRSAKENINNQFGVLDISKWKTHHQGEELERNVGIFGVTVKAFGNFLGATARAVFAFA